MRKTKLLQMHNVSIVVDDLKAAIAFFAELGLELEGETTVEGQWVDRIVALNGVRSDIAMMRTPDGHSRLELTKFQRPTATSVELRAITECCVWQVERRRRTLIGEQPMNAGSGELAGRVRRWNIGTRLSGKMKSNANDFGKTWTDWPLRVPVG